MTAGFANFVVCSLSNFKLNTKFYVPKAFCTTLDQFCYAIASHKQDKPLFLPLYVVSTPRCMMCMLPKNVERHVTSVVTSH